MKDEYEVTFYLTSGEKMVVIFSKEKLEDLVNKFSQSWNTARITDLTWGINFLNVTHYRAKLKE